MWISYLRYVIRESTDQIGKTFEALNGFGCVHFCLVYWPLSTDGDKKTLPGAADTVSVKVASALRLTPQCNVSPSDNRSDPKTYKLIGTEMTNRVLLSVT